MQFLYSYFCENKPKQILDFVAFLTLFFKGTVTDTTANVYRQQYRRGTIIHVEPALEKLNYYPCNSHFLYGL